MKYFLLIGIGIALVILGIQDFRDRKISVWILLFTLILCSAYFLSTNHLYHLPKRILINSAFTSAVLVSGTLLVKIRRPKEALSTFIGTGDFLFLIAISPMFSFEAYLVFLYTSTLIILLIFCVGLINGKKQINGNIPFAGFLAFCCILVLIVNELILIDLTSVSISALFL